MVLANPHFPWGGEARFWECHLTMPGQLDVLRRVAAGRTRHPDGVQPTRGLGPHLLQGPPLHALPAAPRRRGADLVPLRRRGPRDDLDVDQTVDVRGRGRLTGDRSPATMWRTHHGPDAQHAAARLGRRDRRSATGTPTSTTRRCSSSSWACAWPTTWTTSAGCSTRSRGCRGSTPWPSTTPVTPGTPTPRPRRACPTRPPSASCDASTRTWSRPSPSRTASRCSTGASPTTSGSSTPGPAPRAGAARATSRAASSATSWSTRTTRTGCRIPTRTLEGYPVLCGLERTPRSLRTRQNLRRAAALARRGGVTLDDLLDAVFDNASLSVVAAARRDRRSGAGRPDRSTSATSGWTWADAAEVLAAWDGAANLDSVGVVLWREVLCCFDDAAWKVRRCAVRGATSTPTTRWPPRTRSLAAPDDGPDPVTVAVAMAAAALEPSGRRHRRAAGRGAVGQRGEQRIPVHGGGEAEGMLNVLAPVGALASSTVEPPRRRNPLAARARTHRPRPTAATRSPTAPAS